LCKKILWSLPSACKRQRMQRYHLIPPLPAAAAASRQQLYHTVEQQLTRQLLLGCLCCCCCRPARHPQTVLSPGRPPGRTDVAEFLYIARGHSVNKMRNLVREFMDLKKLSRIGPPLGVANQTYFLVIDALRNNTKPIIVTADSITALM
jgi:hypothetical protein